jgi:Putative porin
MHIGIRRMAALLGVAFCSGAMQAHAGAVDELIEALKDKGILTDQQYDKLKSERAAEKDEMKKQEAAKPQAPAAAASTSGGDKWKISDQVKSIELFGDLRARAEDRYAKTNSAAPNDKYDRFRERYAFRLGLRGDVGEHWFYGLRLETSDNPRSTWVSFGDDTNNAGNTGQANKTSDKINVGQIYVGWKPTDWASVVVGRQANPLMTSPMVWDPDISPEGISEKVTYKATDALTLFGTLGQFVYQDVNPDGTAVSGLGLRKQDRWMYAFEAGAEYKISDESSVRAAINTYHYTGGRYGTAAGGTTLGIFQGGSPTATGAYSDNEVGTNNLKVWELPIDYRFPIGDLSALLYGNFAKNSDASERARLAGFRSYGDQDKAFQVGFALGSHGLGLGAGRGLVYGSSAKKNSWEVRTYFQRIEQYALDPNMIDSDFFERTNLQGYYLAAAYAPTDGVITTARLGHAKRYNDNLGTGGFNSDLSAVGTIREYNLFQLDLTVRF